MEISLKYRVIRFLVFLFFGHFILLLNLCSDMIVFIIHCFQNKLHYRKEKMQVLTISKESFKIIYAKIKIENENQIKAINSHTL